MIKQLATAVLAALAMALPVHAAPVETGHLTAELASGVQGIAPGQTVQVALSQKLQDGWHTYWRNPGDSGEATALSWTLPAGWKAGGIVWPAPRRLPVGPLVNYGFEGKVLLPVTITAPADARPGDTVTLKAKANFLVCREICVPETAALELAMPVFDAPTPADPVWGPAIAAALAAAPRPAGLTATFATGAKGVALAVTGDALKGADLSQAYFFPFANGAIDHAQPQAIERGPKGLTLTLTPGPDFQAAAPPKVLDGVLAFGDRAYEVTATPGAAPAGAAGLGPPPARLSGSGGGAGMGLPLAIAFAFVGGLILNLMPCVFPVLAMKAAALAGHGADRAAARAQGLAFGAGVIVTFLALAGVLIGLREAGAAIGWGFQLQSPPVVAALALLMLGVALNLSGLFEVGGSLQNAGSGLASRRGLAGAFFTGALAVVVAAPCTAPFMAPALGWALTLTPVWALVIFLGLALGFAAPFTAIAFVPGILAWLPKPGPWMDGFKKALAFPMYGAAAWLVWVLTLQAGDSALARILAAAVIVAAAAWIAGVAQRQMGQGRRAVPQVVLASLLLVVAVLLAVGPRYADPAAATPGPQSAELDAEPYSAERLAALQAQGRPVFVNYTAAWCVSCQVNDRVALSTDKVAKAFADNHVAYLKADWTRKDAAIAADLARYGRAGVPLYLVYGARGGDAVILPPILTQGLVVRAVEAAARTS